MNISPFTELLLPILSVTMESVEKGEDDAALKSLIDLAENCPKFLRPQLDQLFSACIKIFSDKEQGGCQSALSLDFKTFFISKTISANDLHLHWNLTNPLNNFAGGPVAAPRDRDNRHPRRDGARHGAEGGRGKPGILHPEHTAHDDRG